MLAVIRYSADKFDVQHFFVDSLMKCIRDEDDYNGQKQFINGLCNVAMDTGIHVHLIHHTKKPNHDEVPNRYQAKGSGSISDQVDNVFGVWRNRENNEKPNCIINCDTQRHGEWDGHVALWFDPASLQFRGDAMPNKRVYIKPPRMAA